MSGWALNPITDDFVKEEESNTKEKVTSTQRQIWEWHGPKPRKMQPPIVRRDKERILF